MEFGRHLQSLNLRISHSSVAYSLPVISASVILGIYLSVYDTIIFAAMFAGILLVLLIKKTSKDPSLLFALAVFFSTDLFGINRYYEVPFVAGELTLADLSLILCWMYFLLAMFKTNKPYANSYIALPLFLFMCLALVSMLTALHQSVGLGAILKDFRGIAYYAIFFPVIYLIRNHRQLLSVVKYFYILAAVLAVTSFIQFALGKHLPLPGMLIMTSRDGVTRVISEGQPILSCMMLCGLIVLVSGVRNSVLLSIFTALAILSLLMTVTRSIIIPLFVVFICYLIQYRQHLISNRSLVNIILPVSFIAIVMISMGFLNLFEGNLVYSVYKGNYIRLGRMFSDEYGGRWLETEALIRNIIQNPILGLGLGTNVLEYNIYDPHIETQRYAHNAYLWIAGKMGIPALLIFLWTLYRAITISFKAWNLREVNKLSALRLACGLWLIATMLTAVVAPYIVISKTTMFAGIVLAVIEKCYFFEMTDSRKASQFKTAGTFNK